MNKKTLIIVLLIGVIICCAVWYINKTNSNKCILAYVPYKYIEFDSDELILKKGDEFSFVHNIDINEIESSIEFNIENEEIIKILLDKHDLCLNEDVLEQKNYGDLLKKDGD